MLKPKGYSDMVMALAFLHPVLDELRARGVDEEELSDIVGVTPNVLCDPTLLLPANQIYDALQRASELTGDHQMCFRLGQGMASGTWTPVKPLFLENDTIIDFISEFSAMAEKQGRAARYKLVVEGKYAVLALRRPSSANVNSSYADAMAAGFFIGILKNSLGHAWDNRKVSIVLQNPDLVPESEVRKSSVMLGRNGMNIRFPSQCLGGALSKPKTFVTGPRLTGNPSSELDLNERVRQIIKPQIANRKFGPVQVAEALGMERWKLQDVLGKSGTSVSALREEVKRKEAEKRLKSSSDSIERIANDLGYTDSANFARAFRKWTGVSPSELRNGK